MTQEGIKVWKNTGRERHTYKEARTNKLSRDRKERQCWNAHGFSCTTLHRR